MPMPTLLDQLGSYHPFTALVIGDFMLDQLVYGAAERLSPDAPVPVLKATKTEDRPGGAANVARCLTALKGTVKCFGLVGNDAEGRRLKETLVKEGINVDGLIADPTRHTTVKRSMVGLAQHRHPQKMFRLDIETPSPPEDGVLEELLQRIKQELSTVDVVCIEDYDKGVCPAKICQAIIEMSKQAGKPVLVDPASLDDYTKYRGATIITPNRTEAERVTGKETPLEASDLHNADLTRQLLDDLDLDAVVLTLDRHGALLHEKGSTAGGSKAKVIPTVARSVYDVTGAGDMVLAALAAGSANQFSWPDAVAFANAAAGLEVEVFGVQPIPFALVHREVLLHHAKPEGKARTLEQLSVELASFRESGKKIVLTNGCFDVIHAGHVAYLREAKGLGDILVVGVNSDEQVRQQKGESRPVYPQPERLEILSELQCVDYLIVFPEPTAENLIRAVQPDVYVKGGDYAPGEINEYDLIRELDIDLQILTERPGLSSTQVIEKMGSSK